MDLAGRRGTCWTWASTSCIRNDVAGPRRTTSFGTHNRLVVGSTPTGPTNFRIHIDPPWWWWPQSAGGLTTILTTVCGTHRKISPCKISPSASPHVKAGSSPADRKTNCFGSMVEERRADPRRDEHRAGCGDLAQLGSAWRHRKGWGAGYGSCSRMDGSAVCSR